MSKARSTIMTVANHWKYLVAVFALSALIPAVIYSLVEPFTFIESLEWSVYMLTSTGLGSHGATTLAGQILGVLLMLWGPVLLLALITATVVNYMRVDPNLFTDDEQRELLEGNRLIVEYIKSQQVLDKSRDGVVE